VKADWSRVEAQKRISALLGSFKVGSIEAVICGNDEMALGAIEALKVAGAFKGDADFVPVIGVDGTSYALDSIADGEMLGTVMGDAAAQGEACLRPGLTPSPSGPIGRGRWR